MAGKRNMKPLMFKFLIAMGIIAALAMNMGCGDVDLLQEAGLRFRIAAPVTYDDNGVNDGRFDAYQTDLGGGCDTGEKEDFATLQVTVQYQSDEDMDTDGYIDHIDVQVSPNGTNFFPVDYTITNIQNPRIPANGGSLSLILNLVTPAMKELYVADNGGTYLMPTEVDYEFTMTTYITYTPGDSPEKNYTVPAFSFFISGTEINNCESID